jgi:hypothetical protein
MAASWFSGRLETLDRIDLHFTTPSQSRFSAYYEYLATMVGILARRFRCGSLGLPAADSAQKKTFVEISARAAATKDGRSGRLGKNRRHVATF